MSTLLQCLVRSSDYLLATKSTGSKQTMQPKPLNEYDCSRGSPPTDSPSEKCIVCSPSSATLVDHYYCAT